MPTFSIFDIAGSGMSAQSVRLNATASNLANADSVAATAADTYRAKHPVFQAVEPGAAGQPGGVAVRVAGVIESSDAPDRRYQPGHPLADAEGYVYAPRVNVVDEMVNMISASRSYQNDVEVMKTARDLLLATLKIGQ
jgi:flagellar basal-body rod protein FlgC